VAGSAFSLGWLMAQLFDARRLQVDELFTPPYDPAVQLPLVPDLDPPRRRQLALADLDVLLEAVASGVPAGDVHTAGLSADGDPESFCGQVGVLHQAILDRLVGDDQQVSAYQLGLALSDACWLATPEGGAQAFIVMFQRGQVAALKSWLASAGDAIPHGAAGIVGQSLENWQNWIEVNAKGITQAWTSGQGAQIVKALHIQAIVWHSVLVGDPQTSGSPAMSAWIEASSAVVRATRKVTVSVLRRFWWLVLIIAVVIIAVLVLVIVSLHGADRIWTSLLWVGGCLGGASYGFQSSVGKAVSGVGTGLWDAARADATAWNVTWLPTLPQTGSQRRSLDRAGVAVPVMRANLEAVPPPQAQAQASASASASASAQVQPQPHAGA
jgi:hypothetical protein